MVPGVLDPIARNSYYGQISRVFFPSSQATLSFVSFRKVGAGRKSCPPEVVP